MSCEAIRETSGLARPPTVHLKPRPTTTAAEASSRPCCSTAKRGAPTALPNCGHSSGPEIPWQMTRAASGWWRARQSAQRGEVRPLDAICAGREALSRPKLGTPHATRQRRPCRCRWPPGRHRRQRRLVGSLRVLAVGSSANALRCWPGRYRRRRLSEQRVTLCDTGGAAKSQRQIHGTGRLPMAAGNVERRGSLTFWCGVSSDCVRADVTKGGGSWAPDQVRDAACPDRP
jgi:hypothetical protein